MKRAFWVILILCPLLVSSQVEFEANFTEGCVPLGVTINVTNPPPAGISSYLWEITYPDLSVVTSNSPLYVDILSIPGSYDVTLTINGSESVTINNYITVHDIPEASFSVDDPQGCFPLCVNFSDQTIIADGAIIEWAWDFGNGITSFDPNPSYCYEDPGQYTPVFSVEDEFGCYNDFSIPGLITVSDEFPVIDLVPSGQLDCNPPVAIEFTNNSTASTDLSFLYNFGDGEMLETDDDGIVSHVFDDVGVYNVCFTAEDVIGCASDTCFVVEVFDTPDASFIIDQATICLGTGIVFTDTTVPIPAQWSWDFDGDGNEDSSEQNPVFVYGASGFYSPSLTVTYSDNCTDTESGSYFIEVLEEVVADFAADTLVSCQTPFTVNFTNDSYGPGNLTYEWYVDGALVGTGLDLSYEFTDFGLYDIELAVTSDIGCTVVQSNPGMIQVAEPIIQFDNPTVICTDELVPIFDLNVISIDPVVEWYWDFDEDNIPDWTGQFPDFSYSNLGEYFISLNIVTAAGCQASWTNTQSITVETQVSTDITVSTQVSCAGEAIEFCVEDQPGVTYSWDFGDGSGWQTFAFDTCVIHDYADTGYFDVTISVFNDGCQNFLTYEDFIYIDPPVAEYFYSQSCGDVLEFSFLDNSIEADSLIWDFGDGSPFVYNELDPVHIYDEPGVYTVSVTAINNNVGCPDTFTSLVNVQFPSANLDFGPNTGCPPLDVDFSPTGTGNVYWEVDFGNGDDLVATFDGVSSTWEVELNQDGTTETTTYSALEDFWPTITYENLGDYSITTFAIDNNGCESSTFYADTISVSSDPDFANFTITILEDCDSISIMVEPDTPNLDYTLWQFNGGGWTEDEVAFYTYPTPYDPVLSVTLTAVDAAGCSASLNQPLDIVLPAIPDFQVLSDPSCQNQEVMLANASTGDIVSYSWDFGDPASGALNTSNDENPSHVYQENGAYDICLTVTNAGGCETTLCQEDLVNIITPEAQFTYDANINNCLFGVQFENTTEGNIVCSEWIFGDGQTGIGTSVFHTYPIGVYDLELIVCNEFGCYDTVSVDDIFGYGNVIGPFTATLDDVSCAPFSLDLAAFNINDTSFDYFWDFGNGFGDPDGNTTTSTVYEDPGIYCPSLIMTDANGCPVLIECEEPIIVDEFVFETTDIEPICYGDSLFFEVSGGDSYAWADLTYVDEETPTSFWLEPSQTHDFSITGYYADCQYTEDFTLVVNQLPIVALDLPEEVCQFDEVFTLDVGTPNDIPGEYTIEDVSATEFDPSQDANQAYEVIYIYTDINGCINSDTTDIYINPLPVVTLEPFADLCENDMPLTMSGGAPIDGEYSLDGALLTDFDPSMGYGVYSIQYLYTDDNGCVNTDDQTIEVNAVPALDLSYGLACSENELAITNESSIAEGYINQYIWDFGTIGTSSDEDPTIVLSDFGDYTVSMVATSDDGCVHDTTFTLTVYDSPLAQFVVPEGCAGDLFETMDESTIDQGTIDEWNWTVDGQNSSDGQLWSDQIDLWGSYDLQLSVTSADGCSDSLTQELIVNPNPEVSFDVLQACEGQEVEFTNTSTIPDTNIETVEWQFGDGGSADGDLVYYTYPNDGDYNITLTVTSDAGCIGMINEDITVYPEPVVDFELSDTTMCNNGFITLSDLSSVDVPYVIVEWDWSISDGTTSDEEIWDYYPSTTGYFDISLTVTTSTGCTADTTVESIVTVLPSPMANFDYELSDASLNGLLFDFQDLSYGAIEWYYSFGDGATAIDPFPSHEYEDYGTYLVGLTVTNIYGCQDYHGIEIPADPFYNIYVPNAFTPDGDGINDAFLPEWSGFALKAYNLMIFNRWGELIFQSNDDKEPWIGDVRDGQYFAPDGLYNWRLVIHPHHLSDAVVLTGHVTIIR